MSKNVRKNVVISPSICKSFKHIFYVDICTCDVHVIFTHFRFFERRPRHEKIIQNSCSFKYEGFCTNCVLLRLQAQYSDKTLCISNIFISPIPRQKEIFQITIILETICTNNANFVYSQCALRFL